MDRGSERFAGMAVVPDPVSGTGQAASGGLVRWLAGRAIDPDAAPRFQSLPGPKPVLGLGRLGPAPSWAVLAEGLFDWLALARWGLPACAALGTQGVEKAAASLRGCPRVFLAFDSDDAGREAAERLELLAWTQGRFREPARRHWRRCRACCDATRTRRSSCACWRKGGAHRPIALTPPTPLPLYRSLNRSALTCGVPPRLSPVPNAPPGRTYAQLTTGPARLREPRRLAPRTASRRGIRTAYRHEKPAHQEGDTT